MNFAVISAQNSVPSFLYCLVSNEILRSGSYFPVLSFSSSSLKIFSTLASSSWGNILSSFSARASSTLSPRILTTAGLMYENAKLSFSRTQMISVEFSVISLYFFSLCSISIKLCFRSSSTFSFSVTSRASPRKPVIFPALSRMGLIDASILRSSLLLFNTVYFISFDLPVV